MKNISEVLAIHTCPDEPQPMRAALDSHLDVLEAMYEGQIAPDPPSRKDTAAAFFAAVHDLLDTITPELWALDDGEGGAVMDTIKESLWARFGKPQRLRNRSKGVSAHHKHLHRLGERDGWFCAYCGVPVGCQCADDVQAAVSDHVFPRSRGGSDDDSNRVLACVPCNSSKSDRTPGEWGGPR